MVQNTAPVEACISGNGGLILMLFLAALRASREGHTRSNRLLAGLMLIAARAYNIKIQRRAT